ncbi:MAG: CotH kinase family protein [Lachnospiraceae bacterium]|nr:CotH kinase family protein [Lachnospiraceae bacterium]
MCRYRHQRRLNILMVSAAVLLMVFGMKRAAARENPLSPEYASLLFDDSRVHTIDIRMDDWEGFLEQASLKEYESCTIVIDGEVCEQAGIRVKGHNSRRLIEKYGWNRYSLKVEFDHYVPGQSYHGLDKLALDTSFQDNSYLKSYLAYDMMAHMGVPSPLTSYVWVTVNGAPWGLYLAVEEPEDAFACRNYGEDHGQLYKPDYKSLEDDNEDVALCYVDDDPDSYENIFRKARFDVSEEEKLALIRALQCLSEGEDLEEAVDVEEVLRYFVVQVFVVNMDSYLGRTGHNYFLYEEGGRIQMLPWDYNLAYGTYALGMPDPENNAEKYVNYPIDTPAEGEVMQRRPLFHQLMLQKEYFEEYHRQFDLFLKTYFENGTFERKVEEMAELIRPYVEKDPTAFCSFADHQTGVKTIREFCLLRAESVRGQLDGEIPSTIRGQSVDQSTFVDASSVWIPDMGEIADLKEKKSE